MHWMMKMDEYLGILKENVGEPFEMMVSFLITTPIMIVVLEF